MSKKRERDTHEPFIRMSKRDGMPLWKSIGVRLIANGDPGTGSFCAIIIYA